MEYEPMMTFNHNYKPNSREKLLERRIENLQERIRELEQRTSVQNSPRLDDNKDIDN